MVFPIGPNTGLPVNWRQFVGRDTPAWGANLSWGQQSSAVFPIDINFNDIVTAVPAILGTAVRSSIISGSVTSVSISSGGSGYNIPPFVIFTGGGGAGARATASASGGSVSGVTITAGGQGYTSSPTVTFLGGGIGAGAAATANVSPQLVPVINRTLPLRHPVFTDFVCTRIANVQPLQFNSKIGGAALAIPVPPTAGFQYARLTCVFQPVSYNLFTDGTLASSYNYDESQRFVEPKRINSLFLQNRIGADFIWTEGSPTGPPRGEPLPFGVIQQVARQQIILKWLQVPEPCLFPNGPTGTSPNIDAAYGKVNSQASGGYAAGTILFENWAPEPALFPYSSVVANWVIPQRLWDVTLSFRIFDPPTFPGNPSRGWNVHPWNDGFWYFATQRANLGVGSLLPGDLNAIFVPN